jgi:hypothetical protein
MYSIGASAGQADARRRDAVDAIAHRQGAATQQMLARRRAPRGLRLAGLLTSLLARYIPQRVCASLAPRHQACEPAAMLYI